MEAKIIKVDKQNLDPEVMREAGSMIRMGGLVAFPTETVYGLGADARQKDAASRIYAAKGRPSDNPLIVHIAEFQALRAIVSDIPEKAVRLAQTFWPGPLTMILNKSGEIPYETTGGLDTVAVRMPDHPVALTLIREGGGYIAAPSANTSGRPSPTMAEHVMEDLGDKIDLIIDGGPVGIGIESTIVDMTVEPPMILRPGYINREMLETVVGPVEEDKTLFGDDQDRKPKAPGMKYRHYAPKADMMIVEGSEAAVISKINELIRKDQSVKIGVIATDETKARYIGADVKSIGSRSEEISISRNLYRILREFDREEVSSIYSEAFDLPELGQAVMNRLLKAAGYHVINVKNEIKLRNYRKVVFVCASDTCRAPMAEAIMKSKHVTAPVVIQSKGLVVLFPEPLNQKAEAVMISNGLKMEQHMSSPLEEEDFGDDTLIITMDEEQKQKVLMGYSKAINVYTLKSLVGGDGDIPDPYGGPLTDYGECYEELYRLVTLLVENWNEEEP